MLITSRWIWLKKPEHTVREMRDYLLYRSCTTRSLADGSVLAETSRPQAEREDLTSGATYMMKGLASIELSTN